MMQIVVSAWGFKILRSSKEITEMHHKLGFSLEFSGDLRKSICHKRNKSRCDFCWGNLFSVHA